MEIANTACRVGEMPQARQGFSVIEIKADQSGEENQREDDDLDGFVDGSQKAKIRTNLLAVPASEI